MTNLSRRLPEAKEFFRRKVGSGYPTRTIIAADQGAALRPEKIVVLELSNRQTKYQNNDPLRWNSPVATWHVQTVARGQAAPSEESHPCRQPIHQVVIVVLPRIGCARSGTAAEMDVRRDRSPSATPPMSGGWALWRWLSGSAPRLPRCRLRLLMRPDRRGRTAPPWRRRTRRVFGVRRRAGVDGRATGTGTRGPRRPAEAYEVRFGPRFPLGRPSPRQSLSARLPRRCARGSRFHPRRAPTDACPTTGILPRLRPRLSSSPAPPGWRTTRRCPRLRSARRTWVRRWWRGLDPVRVTERRRRRWRRRRGPHWSAASPGRRWARIRSAR